MSEQWTQYERKRNALEEKWVENIRTTLENQLKRITDDYKRGTYQPDLHLDFGGLASLLLDLYADVGNRFARQTYREHRKAAGRSGRTNVAKMPRGKQMDVHQRSLDYRVKFIEGWRGLGFNEDWAKEVADELRLYGLDLAKKISDTTKKAVAAILAEAQEKGWGIEQTVKVIMERVHDSFASRVETIVRTEVGRAANTGKMKGAQALAVEMDKVWIGAKDWRERPSHVAQNDKAVDMDDKFTNGLRFPGDPKGPAKEVVNCRCTVVFRVRTDPQGKPIPKSYRYT